MLANKLMSAALSGGAEDKLYVDDVFSTYLYTGNGSTQTINNGIDLAGKGGMVWAKSRSNAYDNYLFDTVRGRALSIVLNGTAGNRSPSAAGNDFTAFNSNGFSLGSSFQTSVNESGTQVAWTFRKAPKFFDVVTYTGNGVAGRQIPHGLGIAPGMVIVKKTGGIGGDYGWLTYHSALGGTKFLFLNTTAAAGTVSTAWNNTDPTPTMFTVGASMACNESGATYVAYLFAHDPSADGIIQCGSFTLDGSLNATVNLGWEPQYVLTKKTNGVSNWVVTDMSRGMPASSSAALLYAELSSAEAINEYTPKPTATGFTFKHVAAGTFIYLAIRRPNKPPTSGTQVYQGAALGITSAAGKIPNSANFPVDMFWQGSRNGEPRYTHSKLTGFHYISPDSTSAEVTTDTNSWNYPVQDGIGYGSARDFTDKFAHQFRRAPGFFDVVCYTGTGVARTVPHSLGVAPELMIVKSRSSGTQEWGVQANGDGTKLLKLNSTAAVAINSAYWNDVNPTTAVFTVGASAMANGSGVTYVAYLFATLPGISKVGSYTGNGTTQTIDCGFTTGARFVMIKRTDSGGNWYVFDSVRGIVAGNDPYLQLNTSQAENAYGESDGVDPAVSGFIVNQNVININVSGGQYIFLAIA